MTIRSKLSLFSAAVLSVTALAMAQQAPAPTPAPAINPEQAGADRNSLEKFSREFDLLPGMGRPRPDPNNPPGADLGPDPLGDLASSMTDVHDDLARFKTDKPVQKKEKDVVESLDKVIAALTPKGGGTGSGNTPNGGRRRGGIFEGDPRFGDMHGVDNQGKQWAQLPPKERERILQSRTEGFPAEYESLLQSYYQRLAQEKPADDKTTETPATQPGSR